MSPLRLIFLLLLVPLTVLANSDADDATGLEAKRLPSGLARVVKTYKDTAQGPLVLHLYRTQGAVNPSAPAVVFFSGGGWTKNNLTQFSLHARDLATRGLVAIVCDYRVASRHGTDPWAAVRDARSALRWVRAHAAELGLDPNRIAAGGGSAGAHLALGCALFTGQDEASDDLSLSPRPDALLLFGPVIDTSEVGYGHARLGERWAELHPHAHVASAALPLPPLLLQVGTADPVVPMSSVEALAALWRERGGRFDLVPYEGQAHGFFNYRAQAPDLYERTQAQAVRFLESLGWAQPVVP
jgi:acetyl esterase